MQHADGYMVLAVAHSMGDYVSMLNDLPTERVIPALRFLASEARISQQALGERVGLSQSAMARRFAGDTPMDFEEVTRVAAALGYDVRVTFTERTRAAVAS